MTPHPISPHRPAAALCPPHCESHHSGQNPLPGTHIDPSLPHQVTAVRADTAAPTARTQSKDHEKQSSLNCRECPCKVPSSLQAVLAARGGRACGNTTVFVPRGTGELDRLQGLGWVAGSRTGINIKCNLAGEKVSLIEKVKASYKEKKRQQRIDRCSFSGDGTVYNPGTLVLG